MAPSRAEAQRAVAEGRVVVEGVSVPRPSTPVTPTTPLLLQSPRRFVSRGGDKLEGALLELGVSVAGRRCLDAGAATGGFTDCLLRWGASEVVALDVGTGQLDRTLASDPRVRPMEGVNLRHVEPVEVGAPFDLVVADLSFISLCTVAPALASMTGPTTDLVLLVKPQFEVGRGLVGRSGVVRRPELWSAALERVTRCLEEAGLGVIAICRSPIEGARGNREFFLLGRSGRSGAIDIAAVVAQ